MRLGVADFSELSQIRGVENFAVIVSPRSETEFQIIGALTTNGN